MTRITFLFLLLISSTTTRASVDSSAFHDAEALVSLAPVLPQIRVANKIIQSTSKPGYRLAFGTVFNNNKKNKHIYLSIGAQITYTHFTTIEEAYRYYFINSATKLKLQKYRFENGIVTAGIPIKINYRHNIRSKPKLLLGMGIFPCVQSNPYPLNIYTEAYIGWQCTKRAILTLDISTNMFSYPYNEPIRAQYTLWSLGIGIRYNIQNLKIY